MTLPELVAFDLDGTFWKRKASGQLALRPYIEKIMKYLHINGVDMAVCSNHDDEQEAKDFFKQTTIDIKSRKRTLMSLIKPGCFVIQSGNKNAHFQTVKKKSGVSYSDMLFFDDDPDNGNVEEDKGVNFIEVGQPGLDWETFKRGLKVYNQEQQ
ncbi:magnesium-dependent phosphatase-1 [Mycena sp. CBHHK59/15]|nr:magnesium-dependent phosphatase-1 [Mycena sp. CBHHK59/15]